ncbi:hypothetical protein T09_10388 [Trichinella sp. T9]|nr:hypothetical protein T09_10388 [Trichinella sp. T9]
MQIFSIRLLSQTQTDHFILFRTTSTGNERLRSSISRHGCPAFHQQAISSILNNFIDKLSASTDVADDVVQHQNKRRFQRKPDKQHHLYSVWPITLYNSSKYVSRVSLCKCEDDYCRWHSAACAFSHSNPEMIFII